MNTPDNLPSKEEIDRINAEMAAHETARLTPEKLDRLKAHRASVGVIGARVALSDGSIGHVESIDADFDNMCDVRMLTPNNTPSASVGLCIMDNLTLVPDSVVPMQRSKAWWAEAREFHAMIINAIDNS